MHEARQNPMRQPGRVLERLSVSELSTYRWSFEEDVLQYRALGFRALGIWRAKLSDYGEEKAIELIREHQLFVSSMQWVGGFTGSDGRSFRDAMYDALDAIDLASRFGTKTLVVLTGSRSGHTRNHARKLLVRALTELSEAGRAVGVDLAVEPMHAGCAEEWTFLTSLPQTLDLVGDVGQPNLGIVFDCYHMAQEEAMIHWLPSVVPLVKLVQLGDAKGAPMGEQNRCLLGHGLIPLPVIIQTFESGGFAGYYEVELIGQEVEHLSYQSVLQQTRVAAEGWLSSDLR
jgi:sugar phosphate isomerase/epimerase